MPSVAPLRLRASSSVGATLLTSILAYWTLDSTAWTDSTGNGRTLTNNNSVTTGTGILNNGAVFNGSSNYLSNSSLALGLSDFTLSAWVKPTAGTNQYGILAQYGSGGTTGFTLCVYFGQLDFWSGSDISITAGLVITAGTWWHVVATRTGGTLTLYVNGTSVATGSISSSYNFTDSPFKIGHGYGGYGYCNGSIDEVGVWGRALTFSEITSLYNSGTPLAYSNFATTP